MAFANKNQEDFFFWGVMDINTFRYYVIIIYIYVCINVCMYIIVYMYIYIYIYCL